MDLFFAASKAFWTLAAPSTALTALIVISALSAALIPAVRSLARIVLTTAALLLALAGFSPLSGWMISPLETRFAPYEPREGPKPSGVILLGGAMRALSYGETFRIGLSDAGDRIREAARLARLYPELPVLVSGGLISPRPSEPSEASMMAEFLVEMGVARERILIEDASRSTAENAEQALAAAGPGGKWLLVTSAFHMPRAVGAFRAAGLEVIPAPTDWRHDASPSRQLRAAERLETVDIATKEWIGLLAYRIAGRTDALFPGPGTDAP